MKKILLVLLGVAFACALQAQPYAIGNKVGGGVVFHVTDGGMHGLIAESKNFATKTNQEDAIALANDPTKHSEEGKLFTDWRLPTVEEILLLSKQIAKVGGFVEGHYWTSATQSTERGQTGTLVYFRPTRGPGTQTGDKINKPSAMPSYVRLVRSF